MNKATYDDLIEKSQKHIGKQIPVKEGPNSPANRNPFIDYTFTGVGPTLTFKDSGKETYYVNGILESTEGKIVRDVSLYDIITYFESLPEE